MNIVTIKAKAQLAAKEIEYAAGESISCDIASIIESCFIPDSASEDNKDLIEALGLLKQAQSIVPKHYVVWHDNTSNVLAKYPNLK